MTLLEITLYLSLAAAAYGAYFVVVEVLTLRTQRAVSKEIFDEWPRAVSEGFFGRCLKKYVTASKGCLKRCGTESSRGYLKTSR